MPSSLPGPPPPSPPIAARRARVARRLHGYGPSPRRARPPRLRGDMCSWLAFRYSRPLREQALTTPAGAINFDQFEFERRAAAVEDQNVHRHASSHAAKQTAVDSDRLAGNVRRRRADQVKQRAAKLLGLEQPLLGQVFDQATVELFILDGGARSISTQPISIALTRMFLRAHSSAKPRVRLSTAACAAPYRLALGTPRSAIIEVMLTITPPPLGALVHPAS